MKLLWTVLILLTLGLQFRLWVGEGSLGQVQLLQQQIDEQKAHNAKLAARNQQLNAEVLDLKNGNAALEEKAMSQLGMVAEGETFFLVIED